MDAGIFDGSLGIICALSALKVLKINGTLGKLTRPIEVSEILALKHYYTPFLKCCLNCCCCIAY